MTRRIVVTGPESTGKTTLSLMLAERLGVPCLPEAARAAAEEKLRRGAMLDASDVEPIARRTIAADDAALRTAPPVLVLDTDLLSTVVYARHYYGSCPAWIETEARARRGALYLLCAADIPWTADGVRDRPTNRDDLYEHFRRTLDEFEVPVVRIAGSGASREAAAMAAIAAAVPSAIAEAAVRTNR